MPFPSPSSSATVPPPISWTMLASIAVIRLLIFPSVVVLVHTSQEPRPSKVRKRFLFFFFFPYFDPHIETWASNTCRLSLILCDFFFAATRLILKHRAHRSSFFSPPRFFFSQVWGGFSEQDRSRPCFTLSLPPPRKTVRSFPPTSCLLLGVRRVPFFRSSFRLTLLTKKVLVSVAGSELRLTFFNRPLRLSAGRLLRFAAECFLTGKKTFGPDPPSFCGDFRMLCAILRSPRLFFGAPFPHRRGVFLFFLPHCTGDAIARGSSQPPGTSGHVIHLKSRTLPGAPLFGLPSVQIPDFSYHSRFFGESADFDFLHPDDQGSSLLSLSQQIHQKGFVFCYEKMWSPSDLSFADDRGHT